MFAIDWQSWISKRGSIPMSTERDHEQSTGLRAIPRAPEGTTGDFAHVMYTRAAEIDRSASDDAACVIGAVAEAGDDALFEFAPSNAAELFHQPGDRIDLAPLYAGLLDEHMSAFELAMNNFAGFSSQVDDCTDTAAVGGDAGAVGDL